jgi:hypothetical protein
VRAIGVRRGRSCGGATWTFAPCGWAYHHALKTVGVRAGRRNAAETHQRCPGPRDAEPVRKTGPGARTHRVVELGPPLPVGGGVEPDGVVGAESVGVGSGDEGGALGVGSEGAEPVGVGSGPDVGGGSWGLLGPGAVGLGAVP